MSRSLLALALLAVLTLPLGIAWVRATQVFVLRVRNGELTFLRGRIPQQLFDELADLVRHTPKGTLIVVSDNGRPRLTTKGQFDAGLLQQLRNVVGMYPLAKLRAGGRPR